MSDGTDLRAEFLLDPNVTFLNHGSFGACPRSVLERHHATAAVNVAAWPLGLQAGDEVLSTDLEYGALDLAWEHVCDDFGARYVRTPIRLPVESADELMETIWAGVGPRTRVLFVSHHTSGTALTLPVAELCRRARERGIRTIVDGAHVPGHLPLDLRALDPDYYAGNCHKWQFHFYESAKRYRGGHRVARASDANVTRSRQALAEVLEVDQQFQSFARVPSLPLELLVVGVDRML